MISDNSVQHDARTGAPYQPHGVCTQEQPKAMKNTRNTRNNRQSPNGDFSPPAELLGLYSHFKRDETAHDHSWPTLVANVKTNHSAFSDKGPSDRTGWTRPLPVCSSALLPTPHPALHLRPGSANQDRGLATFDVRHAFHIERFNCFTLHQDTKMQLPVRSPSSGVFLVCKRC